MKLKQSGLIAVLACLIWGLPQVSAGELTLLDKYPIKNPLFVQGLELSPEQELVLGTGLEGESKLGVFNLKTGELDRQEDLPNDYFGEGLTFTPNALWQMTWKEKKVLKRDPKTFEILGEYDMNTEGWGLCYDKDQNVLWRSDGTSTLYKHDPETFELLDQVKIMNGKLTASNLNELEWVDGHIYANRYYRNEIFKIDPQAGQVVDRFDLNPLLEETLTAEELAQIDTPNGIAHIQGKEFYLTGKLFPYLYRVSLESITK